MGQNPEISKRKIAANTPAMELFSPDILSESRALGRRFQMRFLHSQEPRLDRLEFHGNSQKKFEYLQYGNLEDKTRSFIATGVATALPMFILDSLCGRLQTPPQKHILEGAAGTPAAALRNALKKSNGAWYRLFTEFHEQHGKRSRVGSIFGGLNQDVIFLEWDFLAPDCIEIYWNEKPLKLPDEIRHLASEFRNAWKLPSPTFSSIAVVEKDEVQSQPPVKPAEEKAPTPPAQQPPSEKVVVPKADLKLGSIEFAFKSAPKSEPSDSPKPNIPLVDPQLYEIKNPLGLTWGDQDGLIDFWDARQREDQCDRIPVCKKLFEHGLRRTGDDRQDRRGQTLGQAV
jgi:hypothetical protein